MNIASVSFGMARSVPAALWAGLLAVALVAPEVSAATARTDRVSVHSNGSEGDERSARPAISKTGRFVAFQSDATTLVTGDSNAARDVFVHDRRNGKTRRVSVRSNGAQGDGDSSIPSISADGRYVAFRSDATNLVANDTNGEGDIFVHDRHTRRTKRVSVRSNGAQANGGSNLPSISADGRFVAFRSDASDLVANDTNGEGDIFVHDRNTGKTRRVNVRSNGAQANGGSGSPTISANGRFVAFSSSATNLVPNDTNGVSDVFVHDRTTGRTRRVSVRSNGAQGNDSSGSPGMSANGRLVAFSSQASNLVANDTNALETDIFVHDRRSGRTTRVSVSSTGAQALERSFAPDISGSGRFVAFSSRAPNLVANDGNGVDDVFLHDRRNGRTRRLSRHTNGAEGDGDSFEARISGDARVVAFASDASTLVDGDTNGFPDVFVRGPLR